jgi:hypothetical protein
LISRLALSPRPASEICFPFHARRRGFPTWPASHISCSVLFAGWLAWFGVLPYGESGRFQSLHGDRSLCFALCPFPGIDPRRFLTVKERRGFHCWAGVVWLANKSSSAAI